MQPPPRAAANPTERQLALERATPQGGASRAPVLRVLGDELTRAMQELTQHGDPPPYFLAYQATDSTRLNLAVHNGAIVAVEDSRARQLDVTVRVGSHALDNTHSSEDGPSFPDTGAVQLPLTDDDWALRMAIWRSTDESYQQAARQFAEVKASKTVKVADDDPSPDFSREPATRYLEEPPRLAVDRARWEARLKAASSLYRSQPDVQAWLVHLEVTGGARYFVSSEGSEVQTGNQHFRLQTVATTTADDGMELERAEVFEANTADAMPTDEQVKQRIQGAIRDLGLLKRAPIADPYEGPAILEGETAGYFFHEIFGHRVEGNRQREDEEGQTFAKKLGQAVMPAFVNIYDDPTIVRANGVWLSGHYLYDDEGVPAQRVSLVERGTLKGFLLSRTPVRGLLRSNGHGRREPGSPLVARQGNLVIDPQDVTTRDELTRKLIEEVKRQNKPYGLRFVKTESGFTSTIEASPQGFKVRPSMVYRVYPDGREELIRGVDLEGTPLTALSEIVAAANDFAVANGVCGAESGSIPVSAVSPSLLIRRVEVARRRKGRDRPPILPPPPLEGGAS